MISVNDILDYLVARSAAPSTFGAQLDRLRFGIQSTPDPFRQKREVEDQLLEQAVLIRCIDEFARREQFATPTRQRAAVDAGYKTLAKIQDKTRHPQGAIALSILRAYHERCTCSRGQSEERGLLAVYQYIGNVAPSLVPPPPKNEPDLEHAFRIGEAKRARALACEAYADALLALRDHVRTFTNREMKKDDQSGSSPKPRPPRDAA